MLAEFAPAKVNLTLRVLGRRADGYHELESLVAFADAGDRLALASAPTLTLAVRGPSAAAAGPDADNLVLKAALALKERVPELRLGRFTLTKRLPVAAGLGGGSSDAAAALRLLARANALRGDDPHLMAAAGATGADVPVCLAPQARIMRGVGDILTPPLGLAPLPALLVNPGVAVATRDVFARLALGDARQVSVIPDGSTREVLLRFVKDAGNDLEPPAVALAPVIAEVLSALRALPGCEVARMSGSGATCFGLFRSRQAARGGARRLRYERPGWWVRATTLR